MVQIQKFVHQAEYREIGKTVSKWQEQVFEASSYFRLMKKEKMVDDLQVSYVVLDHIHNFLSSGVKEKGALYVAIDNLQKIQGIALVSFEKEVKIEAITTAPWNIMKSDKLPGVGKALIQKIAEDAVANQKPFDVVVESSRQSIGFYEKCGFECKSPKNKFELTLSHQKMKKVQKQALKPSVFTSSFYHLKKKVVDLRIRFDVIGVVKNVSKKVLHSLFCCRARRVQG